MLVFDWWRPLAAEKSTINRPKWSKSDPIFKTPRKVVKVFSQSAKFHPHFRIVSVIWSKKTLDLALKYYSGAPWRQKKVLQIGQKGLN